MSGVAPLQSYGHVVNGATANQTQDMRTNLKTATPYGGTGACMASVLSWFFGPTADSFVKNPCEQLDAWYQAWEKIDAAERKATRTTWAMTVSNCLKGHSLAIPRGPLEATINTILNLGWRPDAPD